MTNHHILLTVPTENASETIEISVIFHDGTSQSWAGDEIEKGYHIHVNAVLSNDGIKRIRPYSGLSRFIAPSEDFNHADISKLEIRSTIIANLAFSVARANKLSITKDGVRLMRQYRNRVDINNFTLHPSPLIH